VVEGIGNVNDRQRGAGGDIERALDYKRSHEEMCHQPCSLFQNQLKLRRRVGGRLERSNVTTKCGQ